MALRDTVEKNRAYMREYMRRRRGSKTRRERADRRPIVLPHPVYADLTAAAFGDPPIGRRAIDARQLITCQRPGGRTMRKKPTIIDKYKAHEIFLFGALSHLHPTRQVIRPANRDVWVHFDDGALLARQGFISLPLDFEPAVFVWDLRRRHTELLLKGRGL